MEKKLKESLSKIFYLLIIFSITLVGIFFLLETNFHGEKEKKLALDNAVEVSTQKEYAFNHFFLHAKESIFALRSSKSFTKFLENKNSNIEDLFLVAAKSHPAFMQLRYIDKKGNERIRIDRKKEHGKTFFIPKDKLQNKSHRYYFEESKKRPLEKIWFSKLDLNIENKQIEIPYKPTLRAILPIGNNGSFDGILIINYFMEEFIHKLIENPLYDTILANSDGDILFHYDTSKSWSAYGSNKDELRSEFPTQINQILTQPLIQNNNFFSKRMDLPLKENLILIMQLNKKYLNNSQNEKYNMNLSIAVIVFILAAVLAFIISKILNRIFNTFFERQNILRKKIEEKRDLILFEKEQLQKEKNRYKALLDLATDGIHIIDLQGNIVEFSDSFAKMLGYTHKELSKLNVRDWDAMIPDEDINGIIERVVQNEESFYTKHKRKDGEIIDVQISAKGVKIGEETFLYASARDMSDIISFKETILEKTKLLNDAQSLALLGSWSLDLVSNKLIWSDEIFNIFEINKERFEASYEFFLNAIHPEDRELVNNTYQESVKNRTCYDIKHRLLFPQGRIKYVRERGITEYNKFNEPIISRGTVQDITKEYTLESEFETIFNNTIDGLAILDLNNHFLDFNEAYLKMTGYQREELLSMSCLELSHPEDIEDSEKIIKEVLEKGFIKDYEKKYITKSGEVVIVNMSISLLPDRQRILISTKDITDKKVIESQTKLASMGEMIGNIAHQWRQPLSSIATIASGIGVRSEFGVLKEEEIIPDMKDIITQTEYLSKTIDDFKNFIKVYEEKENVPIEKIIDKTLSILKPVMINNYITVITNIEDNAVIYVYENELIQVLINIMNNSKDALVENIDSKEERYIFISATKDKKNLKLKIKDNAGGIPKNIIDRIFEPYFTTKHQSKGTGLGLSMAYKILNEHHDATLNVYNETYEYNGSKYTGAVFEIVLEIFE